jgi:hypothetical protein
MIVIMMLMPTTILIMVFIMMLVIADVYYNFDYGINYDIDNDHAITADVIYHSDNVVL